VSKENFIAPDDKIIADIVEFYGIKDEFAHGQLLARGTSESKLLYFISSSIKKNIFDRGLQHRVKGIHSGLRAFERRSTKDNDKRYRPCQESIHFIFPHMTKRCYVISCDNFIKCLGEGAIKIEIFSEELATQMRALSVGVFAVAFEGYERNVTKKFFITLWKCRGDHVNCLVANAELAGFQSKLNSLKGS